MNVLVRTAIQASTLVIAGSLLMLSATREGSAERVITVISLTVGLLVAVTTIVLSRYGRQARNLIRRRRTDGSNARSVSPQEDQ
ncbi:hypothetical protein FB566_1610 [Stackebrandtia endophytica]|uniref:Uncharacterized protein n=1 Tax=Stackebrandtia endophytica TaxID=1496996 RepID=A0A543AU16_9ACTN|nr:hypothetical protein [Stackebrandtia endophytica]TQL76090.1 hypothetical protein FB566_1610 [Stackebrandtia endophytica]